MLKKLALLSIWLALPLCAQTINPNQVRPATTNGQVLTTVTANQPPSWQSPATGVGVAATPPCTVNGGAGPVTSGTATVFCPSSTFQYAYTQQGTGQYVLVPFTSSVCGATTGGSAGYINGSYGPPLVLSYGGFFITGGQNGYCTFSNPVLPSGVTTGQITAIYAVGWKAETSFDNANPTETTHLVFSGTSIPGGAVVRNGTVGGMGPTPFQYGLQLTGTLANFSSITATAAGATNAGQGGGGLSYTAALEVDYTGTPVVQSGNVNLGPGFGWDATTDTLSLVPFAIYPITVSAMKGLPEQPATTYNLVLDGASTTDCSTGGGSNTVWCKADGAGGFTGFPFGGSGINQLTGDGTAGPGSGSQALTLATVNSGPGTCGDSTHVCQITTNGKGLTTAQTQVAITGGGGGLNGTVTYTSSQTASSSDNGKLVIMNCSGACAYTLPATQPSTTWQIALQSVGSTTATVGLSGDTYNGGASAPVLVKYDALPIWANSATSTDYDGGTPLVAGSNVSVTPAANGKTIASTGGGSGPSSIVAGSNVTITEGSPCTTGSCTINASGSGGSTGIPFIPIQEGGGTNGSNGTNYTYTFPQAAAASGNTLFILASADGSGTVNCPSGWTADFNITAATYSRLMLCQKTSASDTTAAFTMANSSTISVYFWELPGARTFDQLATATVTETPVFRTPNLTPTAGSFVVSAAGIVNNNSGISIYYSPLVYSQFLTDPTWKSIFVGSSANGSRTLAAFVSQISATGTLLTPPLNSNGAVIVFIGGGLTEATFSIK